MDPICPLLTLGTDRRAVCDAFDADHRCGAADGPDPIPRRHQMEFCLGSNHAECPHFTRHAMSLALPAISDVPAPAPDVVLGPTRLVVDPQSGLAAHPSFSIAGRSLAAALVLLAAGTGAVATGTVDRVSQLLAGSGRRDSVSVVTPTLTPTPSPSEVASPSATAIPSTPAPSASPSPTATPVPTSKPTTAVLQTRTCVVQPGDTLHAIAERFGTTVAALQAANGISDQNMIQVGQELIIP